MQESLNKDSRSKLRTILVIWGAMVMALIVYFIVAYIIFTTKSMHFMKTPDFLNEVFIGGISYKIAALILSFAIFIGAYIYFNSRYKKLVMQIKEENISDVNDRLNAFSPLYTTLMFTVLALYEAIAIIGLVIFLTTGDINTFSTFLIIALFGFFTVMPTKNKLIPQI